MLNIALRAFHEASYWYGEQVSQRRGDYEMARSIEQRVSQTLATHMGHAPLLVRDFEAQNWIQPWLLTALHNTASSDPRPGVMIVLYRALLRHACGRHYIHESIPVSVSLSCTARIIVFNRLGSCVSLAALLTSLPKSARAAGFAPGVHVLDRRG